MICIVLIHYSVIMYRNVMVPMSLFLSVKERNKRRQEKKRRKGTRAMERRCDRDRDASRPSPIAIVITASLHDQRSVVPQHVKQPEKRKVKLANERARDREEKGKEEREKGARKKKEGKKGGERS